MPPVTFIGSLCKIHVALCSKIADAHGIEVHNVGSLFIFGHFSDFCCITPEVSRGVQEGPIPRGPNHCGGRITVGAKKSHKCQKHFFQKSTFASERPQVRTWGHQTCFFPQAPSNLVTPLHITIV